MTVSGRARLSEPFHRETLNSPHHRSKPKAGAEPKTIHLENRHLHADRLSFGADDRLQAEDLRSSDVSSRGLAARVSKHLGVLKQAGLVRDRHEGRQTHYSARLGALAPLIDWTSKMAGFWQNRFDHLEDLLKRIDQ